ncbi:hypothetical protein [Streptomyces sp. NPDC046182]|uniref:hypothetical protein n=1 Tax=Streptomyces sp. NPDC046182 TaxID=3154601 RepID=UPI00340636FC
MLATRPVHGQGPSRGYGPRAIGGPRRDGKSEGGEDLLVPVRDALPPFLVLVSVQARLEGFRLRVRVVLLVGLGLLGEETAVLLVKVR